MLGFISNQGLTQTPYNSAATNLVTNGDISYVINVEDDTTQCFSDLNLLTDNLVVQTVDAANGIYYFQMGFDLHGHATNTNVCYM